MFINFYHKLLNRHNNGKLTSNNRKLFYYINAVMQ